MADRLIVAVATAGRPALLDRLLKSLAACELPKNYSGTIVVENGPKTDAEGSATQFAEQLGTRYLSFPEPNKSRALNLVLDEAGDSLIVFFDDDVRVAPQALTAYADAAAGVESGSYFGGPLRVDYDVEPPEWLRPFLPCSAKGWSLSEEDEGADSPPWFLGANWAVFAHDARRAGGFNPAKGPHRRDLTIGEETEMQKGLRRLGCQPVYVPDAVVWHYVPPERCSPTWALRRAYRYGINCGLAEVDPAATLFGFPRWMARQWLTKGFRSLRAQFSRQRSARFEAACDFWFYSGMLVGRRAARRIQHVSEGKSS